MTLLERIRTLCRERKDISITTLEQILGYSNGSLAKAKDMPSSRVLEIANYLDVSTDYLLKGEKEYAPSSQPSVEYVKLISMYEKLSEEQKNAIKAMMASMITE